MAYSISYVIICTMPGLWQSSHGRSISDSSRETGTTSSSRKHSLTVLSNNSLSSPAALSKALNLSFVLRFPAASSSSSLSKPLLMSCLFFTLAMVFLLPYTTPALSFSMLIFGILSFILIYPSMNSGISISPRSYLNWSLRSFM